MKKCRNCGGEPIKTPPKTNGNGQSTKVTTIIGNKKNPSSRKTKI